MDWDYLRYVHALATAGNLSRAGEILGVHQTTVLRRLDQMEEQLGVQLFERTRDGVMLTPAGETAFSEAERFSSDMAALEQKLKGQETLPFGKVRLATTDTLLTGLVNPILSELVTAYPGIQLDISTGSDVLSLSRRDTDIALCPTNHPQENMTGQRIANIESAIYCAVPYIDCNPDFDPDHPEAQAWVVPDDSFNHLATGRWYEKHLKASQPVIRCNSLHTMYTLIRAGSGVGVLPCYMGDSCAELQRLSAPLEAEGIELWLLTHQNLRQRARTRLAMEFIAGKLQALQPLIEGKREAKSST
ncbi:LysR family transcriptional regulator [Marinobacter caseinilyticus]|uniref:LysR family transcriptional regulator n=1 Tax=Marinobacter caseinilyticus TaxID=2692195 RepID=UPI00140BB2BF|nr:LysR family transcriptional regulator [Marinobacter caseinilyticus]